MKDMRDYIKEQCDLAQTYSNDGAYASAGRILHDLSHRVNEHAREVHKDLKELRAKK